MEIKTQDTAIPNRRHYQAKPFYSQIVKRRKVGETPTTHGGKWITRLKEVTLIRMLLDGYRPKEAPGMAFYYDTNRMITVAEHLAEAARTQTDPEVKEALRRECDGLKELRYRLMKEYISVDRE